MSTLPLLHSLHGVNIGAWHFEPTVIAGTFIAVSFYFYGMITLAHTRSYWRAALFLTGVSVMFLALVSPLDAAADRLLSMHMLQHVFLTTFGPPLVLLGLPPGLLTPVLSSPRVLKVARTLFSPVVTATLFIVNMWLWHIPPVYGLALDNVWAHVAMHLAFMGTGILFWWPVIQPSQEVGRVGDGARLLYLFATGMPMALLAVMFFASGNVIYDHYDTADRLWGISAIDDQQVAGLIMGVLGELASFVAITWLFFRFLDREEQAAAVGQPARPADAGPAR